VSHASENRARVEPLVRTLGADSRAPFLQRRVSGGGRHNARNRWGDPLPKIEHRLDTATRARQAHTNDHFRGIFARLAQANNGKILSAGASRYLDHPAGGCRMGSDPSESVCDSYGQTHDHENLFVAGSPTLPTAGCTNGLASHFGLFAYLTSSFI